MRNPNPSIAERARFGRMNDIVIPLTRDSVHAAVRDAARTAAAAWAATPLHARLATIRRFRRLAANAADTLAATIARPHADTIVAEILPLLEAARFLERRAPDLLAPRRLRAGRPAWLLGVTATIRRDPLGAVLILAPGNYPLFLPGTQALQALVAGNAVCWKPAPGTEAPAHAMAALLAQAGLPPRTLQILDPRDGPEAIEHAYDRIVLTGSAETGIRVLQAAAPHLTPATMELSGADPVFVLPGADLALVASCLAYGLRLNAGATCIAPRRVMVPHTMAAELETRLLPMLPPIPDARTPAPIAARLATLLAAAVAQGARLHHPGPARPAILADATPDMDILRHDVFAPWLALIPVADAEAALRHDRLCPFALGASIFGPPAEAQALATRLRAGSVCINDLIVPTADPRLPFGGAARSGFGRTRGAEGLLEMTAPRTISERRRFRPHLAPPTPADPTRFAAMARLLHGGPAAWWPALRALAGP